MSLLLGVGFLGVRYGWTTSILDCTRAGGTITCHVSEIGVLGLNVREATVPVLLGASLQDCTLNVGCTGRVRTSRGPVNRVILESPGGPVPLTSSWSNTALEEKRAFVARVQSFIDSHTAASLHTTLADRALGILALVITGVGLIVAASVVRLPD